MAMSTFSVNNLRHGLLVSVLILSLLGAAGAEMVRGVVVYTDSDYVIFYTNRGFSVAEYYGGFYLLETEDLVVGDLDSYGFTDVFCPAKDRSARVYIDDWMMSKDDALEWLFEKKR